MSRVGHEDIEHRTLSFLWRSRGTAEGGDSQPCKRARGQTFDTVRWLTSVSLNHVNQLAIHSHSSGLFISRPVQNYLLVLSTINTFELVLKKFCDHKKLLEVFFSNVFSCFVVSTLFNYNVNYIASINAAFLKHRC